MSTALKVELFLNATWTDVTAYVLQENGVSITQGVRNESGTADASTCTLTLLNDGRFTPRNTAGAYYPYVTRNTPLRVSVNTVERFRGEVPEWPTRWNENKSFVTTAIVPSGILRRLARSSALDSTLKSATRAIANAGHIIGYWPVEDSAGSTSIASGLSGGAAGVIASGPPVFGASDPGVMSRPIATWKNASASFTAALGGGAQAFTAGFLVSFPATGQLTGGEQLAGFTNLGGTAVQWNILYSPTSGGNVLLQVFNSAGAQLIATNGPSGLDGLTVFVKLEVIQNGGNVDWALSATGGPGGTVTGSLVGQFIVPLGAATIGAGTIAMGVPVPIGHLILGDNSTVLFTSAFDGGYSAYAGETITARLARLASQSGVAIAVTAATYNPAEMGAQPDGSLLQVLRAAEKADAGGILRDSVNVVGLAYITRAARYNDAQPAVALDYSLKQVVPPLEPTDDDQNLRNDVTANRLNGSSGRATKSSGALSTASYPAGVGPYPFEDTYAIYLDSKAQYLAQWLLALGTIDETRWPAITVDLIANASLVTAINAARPGSPLVITNLPAIAGTATATLQIIGWTENLTQHQRHITFNCVPGGIWHVFQLDSSTFGRLDTGRLAY